MANVVQVAWARYLRQLEREPLKTKVSLVAFTVRHGTLINNASNLRSVQAITSGSLAALSDITAQKLVSNAPLNWRRTLAMALFGLIWSGPSNHYWQKFTNQLFKGKKDAASVIQKVCNGSRQKPDHLHACKNQAVFMLRLDRHSLCDAGADRQPGLQPSLQPAGDGLHCNSC